MQPTTPIPTDKLRIAVELSNIADNDPIYALTMARAIMHILTPYIPPTPEE